MIDEKTIDLIIERLNARVRRANRVYLRNIAKSIKQLKQLTPSEAHKLVQILKYGGSYEQTIDEMTKLTKMNLDELDSIFYNYAKKDQLFYKQFYEYRNIPFVPYDRNKAVLSQNKAIREAVKTEMYNYLRTNVLGYTISDKKGHLIFKGLRDTYNDVLDLAVLNVGQGKETFDSAMASVMRELSKSGLKTLNYESGRNIRLDSAVEMHLRGRLTELHNENQKIYGEEFGADGIEITVHENPAPDHEKVQGRQFSIVKPGKNKQSEWDKLQAGKVAKDYEGKYYSLDHDKKNGYRPIGEMNCYHRIFTIVLGVSKPRYSDKQLKEIRQRNDDGFYMYDKKKGKDVHYTNYQGTQLQRSIERKVREQKDLEMLAQETGNTNLVLECQNNINKLMKSYRELSEKSGLPMEVERLQVVDYRPAKVSK